MGFKRVNFLSFQYMYTEPNNSTAGTKQFTLFDKYKKKKTRLLSLTLSGIHAYYYVLCHNICQSQAVNNSYRSLTADLHGGHKLQIRCKHSQWYSFGHIKPLKDTFNCN